MFDNFLTTKMTPPKLNVWFIEASLNFPLYDMQNKFLDIFILVVSWKIKIDNIGKFFPTGYFYCFSHVLILILPIP